MLHAKHLWILRVTVLQSWIVTQSLTNSAGEACFLLRCSCPVTSCTAWSLEHPFGWQSPTPVICLRRAHFCAYSAQGSEATGTASVLTVRYLFSVPTDDPTWQCMGRRVGGDFPRNCPRSQKLHYIIGHKESEVLLTIYSWLLPV